MLKTQECVLEFMRAMDHAALTNEDRPGLKNMKWDLLKGLISEEVNDELLPMMNRLQHAVETDCDQYTILHFWSEVIDGLCDSIVVLHNAANAMGIDLEPFFDEVHRTNMLKKDGPIREDGKRLKPPDWEPPRIKEMLKQLLTVGHT